jgi:hypothetical protein
MTRQQKILLILLGILVLALLYGIFSYPRQKRVGNNAPSPVERPRPAPTGTITPAEPEHPRLPSVAEESPAGDEEGVKRNIFAPLYPFVPPSPPEILLPRKGVAQPALEQKPAPPPLRLIGSLEKDHRQLFFLAQAKELYIVHREEPFGTDNRYRVVDAGADEVIVESMNGVETIHLSVSRTVSFVEKVGALTGGISRPSFRSPPVVDFVLPEPPAATGEGLPSERAAGPVNSGSLKTGADAVSEGGADAGNGAAVVTPVEEIRDE